MRGYYFIMKNIVIIFCYALLLSSCGIFKKKKTEKKNIVDKSVLISEEHSVKALSVEVDTTNVWRKIKKIKIVPRDTINPVVISDSNGNTQTIHNAKVITITDDNSVEAKRRETTKEVQLEKKENIVRRNTIDRSVTRSEVEVEGFNFKAVLQYLIVVLVLVCVALWMYKSNT